VKLAHLEPRVTLEQREQLEPPVRMVPLVLKVTRATLDRPVPLVLLVQPDRPVPLALLELLAKMAVER
jgi:hypothetical protein